jgi:glutamate racemase
MKIGFFDSGLGGLIILKSVAEKLPQYDYAYYGDTKNLPYGDKTEAQIFEFSKVAIEYLFKNDCVLVVVACNTASAESLRVLQDTWLREKYPDRKILGVIVPTVEEVIEEGVKDVLLIATRRTVDSNKYQVELSNRTESVVTLEQIATPELVPFIELNELEAATIAAILAIERAVGESEAVILGCTHYTQIKTQLREHFGNTKKIISQDEIIPKKLEQYLNNHPEIKSRLTDTGERSIHLTQHRADYDVLIGQFLGGVFLGE